MSTTEKIVVPPTPTLPQLRVVHYLLSERDGKHVAHCLDFDLVCVGSSREQASQKLDNLVKAHIEYALDTGRVVNLTTQAPTHFWRQFFEGKSIDLEPRTIHITVPETAQVVALNSPEGEIGVLARQLQNAAQ
jgi:hypothetical protein